MHLSNLSNNKILFACNDWGMGHLMRSIPIINQLIRQENEILFAGTIFQIEVIKEYIPTIETILYQGYPFKFKGDGRWNKEMLRNTRNLLLGIKEDKTFVQKIIKVEKITLTISDHRYGFRHKIIPSIFITHQINLPVKGIENIANHWHTKKLKKFSSIWVLDNENHSFAGKLSTPTCKLPIHYLGIQSRFEKRDLPKKDFILAVISGPEPYAEQLFREVIEIAKNSNETFKCISPKNYQIESLPINLEIVNQLYWKEKDTLFYQCKSIISRSGYTTIMDLAVLQIPAILIPTPGQNEQEYLYLLNKKTKLNKIMKIKLLIILFLLPFLGISQSIKGNWEGELTIQNFRLPLIFHIDSTQNGLSATMDSPKQGAKGIPTSQISFKENTLKIEINQIKFEYSGKLISPESIQGSLTQRGQSFPMELKRQTGELKTEKKPQEPNSPFPYNSEEVTFVNPNGGHQLAGTFTFPTTNKKYKTIILISGSGPQNRDEELLGHKPFLVLSDYLTKQGYAVLRYDDRGVGKSTGNFSTATSMDFATDVEAAKNYLKNRKEVETIGLMGHSEGGMIAPIVASRNSDISFIVLLAGPGTPIKELLLDQYELIAKANKASDKEIQQTKNFNANVFDLFIQQKDTNYIKNEIISEQKRLMGDKYNEEQALIIYNQLNTPWFRYFLTFDPKVYLSQVKCPVLAVNGSLDLQVPSEKNLRAIKEILTQSGNTNFKTIELKKLNHLFQKSKTGNPAEYGILEETFSPNALRTITEWLNIL